MCATGKCHAGCAIVRRRLNGVDRENVTQAGIPKECRLKRLGDVAQAPHKADNPSMQTPYEIAKAGGKHSGLVRRYASEPDRQVEKALRSLDRRISEHLDKIANPGEYVGSGVSQQQIGYLVNSYWPKEIAGYRAEVEVLSAMLKERKHGQ